MDDQPGRCADGDATASSGRGIMTLRPLRRTRLAGV